jgi:uncharacterized protein YbjQ (UPF0145 family)
MGQGLTEIVAYGTAVRLAAKPQDA